MKRLLPLLLALCLVLCACGGQTAETEPSTEATAPTTEATAEPTTEATELPVLYRNPLNGEPLDAPFAGRAVAVVINNLKGALPHHGVADADFLYEVETEGGITRCLAVYTDLEGVGSIGPVRSARTFFNNVALSYEAPIVHCGGSVRGRNAYADSDGGKISGWEHLDQVYNGGYFFRDKDRYSSGYNWEHTLFTTGEDLLKAMADKGYADEKQRDFGLQFDEEVKLDSTIAQKVVVSFRGDKTTTFTYDADTGLYKTEQYGMTYVDANTGEQMTFKNVMVLYTSQWNRHDGEYSRSYYELSGEGEGYFAVNGEIIKIKWSRQDMNSPFVYTLEDGTPVTLGVGTTYVAIASETSEPVNYQ